MKSLAPFHSLILLFSFSQSCTSNQECKQPELPLCRGIQVALHISGGASGFNESIQISDHWQLSSVGRGHGWVRKLEPEEQRRLVKATQTFEYLNWTLQKENEKDSDVATTITARGSGSGPAGEKDARLLHALVEGFIHANRPQSTRQKHLTANETR